MVTGCSNFDLEVIRRVWKTHYANEFEFEPIGSHVISKGISRNINGIVGFGMVRSLAEVIMILDKDKSNTIKVKSIYELIKNAMIIAQLEGYSQLHAFVQDKEFASHLKEHFNFRNTVGEALVLDV